jgi:hypothetical protein
VWKGSSVLIHFVESSMRMLFNNIHKGGSKNISLHKVIFKILKLALKCWQHNINLFNAQDLKLIIATNNEEGAQKHLRKWGETLIFSLNLVILFFKVTPCFMTTLRILMMCLPSFYGLSLVSLLPCCTFP